MKSSARSGRFSAPVPKPVLLAVVIVLLLCCYGVGLAVALIGPPHGTPTPTVTPTAVPTTPGG